MPRQFTFCMEIEAGTLHGWRVSKYYKQEQGCLYVRPVWVTNRRRSAVIAMLGSSRRMLQFRLGMDGPWRSTKQGGLSDFVSHTWQFLVSFLVHIIRDRSCQLFSFMTYTDVCYFSLSVQAYRPKFVQHRKFTPFCSRYILISYLVSHNASCEIDHEHNVVDSYHIPGSSWCHF